MGAQGTGSGTFDPWGAPSRPVDERPAQGTRRDGAGFDPWADEVPSVQDEGASAPVREGSLGGHWDPAAEFGVGAETAPHTRARSDGNDVLIVCTGNICRSPYIERVLAHQVRDLPIGVRSAGTGALVDHAIEPGSVRLLAAAGVKDDDFAARQLEPGMVRDSDLILTATRYHRRETVRVGRSGMNKTFALVDFADLVQDVTDDEIRAAEGGSAVAKLVRAAELRRPHVHARVDGADIPDPFRLADSAFDEMQVRSDPAIAVIADALRRAVAVSGSEV